jgi:hypothetical protein
LGIGPVAHDNAACHKRAAWLTPDAPAAFLLERVRPRAHRCAISEGEADKRSPIGQIRATYRPAIKGPVALDARDRRAIDAAHGYCFAYRDAVRLRPVNRTTTRPIYSIGDDDLVTGGRGINRVLDGDRSSRPANIGWRRIRAADIDVQGGAIGQTD